MYVHCRNSDIKRLKGHLSQKSVFYFVSFINFFICTKLYIVQYSTVHKLQSLKHSHGKWRTYFLCLKISSRENSHARPITGLLWGRRAPLVGNNICLLERQHVSFPPIASFQIQPWMYSQSTYICRVQSSVCRLPKY